MFDKINRLSIEFTKECNFNCEYCHQSHSSGFLDFDSLKKRVEFINNLDNLDRDLVDIALSGGEVTIYGDIFKEYLIYLRDSISTKNKQFTAMTNMSNMELILDLIRTGLLRKDRVGISWDGFNSQRKSGFSDDHFVESLGKLANSEFRDDVFLQVSITPENISSLYDTIKFVKGMGLTNVGTYLVTGKTYSDNDAIEYDKQLDLISRLFVESYTKDDVKLRFFTFHKCFRDYVLRNKADISDTTRCGKIGQALHFGMNGFIYPCIYFGDHDSFRIGSLEEGLYKDKLAEFESGYFSKSNCDINCKNKHCMCCAASCYVVGKGFNERNMNWCKMFEIERKWFYNTMNFLMPYITEYSINNYWGRVNEPS